MKDDLTKDKSDVKGDSAAESVKNTAINAYNTTTETLQNTYEKTADAVSNTFGADKK